MMTDIQQTHSSYVNFWKELKLLVFMVCFVVCVTWLSPKESLLNSIFNLISIQNAHNNFKKILIL